MSGTGVVTDEVGADLEFDAVVVGAGFSGLYALYSLRERLGLSVQVLEAADGVGGTWWWNRYPGARCDSESYYYSYSFDDALQQDWSYDERYAAQPEVLRYLNHVTDRFDLRRDIRFGTRVRCARYDEAANRWEVTTDAGDRIRAQFLVTGVGCLSSASTPDLPGLDSFEGRWVHTGEWPHEGVDLAGKRVGLFGTGATGIQAAVAIAPQARHLTVFQRTPAYSTPAGNHPVDAAYWREIKADYPQIRAQARATPNGHPFDQAQRSALEVGADEREAAYQAAWERGSLRFRGTFRDLLLDNAANETAAEFIRAKIRQIVQDPATATALTPTDYPYAAKRPPIDSGWFEMFNRDNVSLVDLRATPLERVTPAGVKTTAGEIALDLIVFATGFDAITGTLLKMDIRGRGGLALTEAWREGPKTYLGLQVPSFPNLFMITGPQSPSVLCNLPVPIEQHVEWITACIAHLRDHDLSRIEPTQAAARAWGQEVQRAADATLLPQAASSWYLGANVPGKPQVFMPYAGGMAHYAGLCEDVAAKGYEGFVLGR